MVTKLVEKFIMLLNLLLLHVTSCSCFMRRHVNLLDVLLQNIKLIADFDHSSFKLVGKIFIFLDFCFILADLCALQLLIVMLEVSKLLLNAVYVLSMLLVMLFDLDFVVIKISIYDHYLVLYCKKLLVEVKNITMDVVVHLSKHCNVKKLLNEVFLLPLPQSEEVVCLV